LVIALNSLFSLLFLLSLSLSSLSLFLSKDEVCRKKRERKETLTSAGAE